MMLFTPEQLAAIDRQSRVNPNAVNRALFFKATGLPGDLATAVRIARTDPDPEARAAAAAVVGAVQTVLGIPPLSAARGWW